MRKKIYTILFLSLSLFACQHKSENENQVVYITNINQNNVDDLNFSNHFKQFLIDNNYDPSTIQVAGYYNQEYYYYQELLENIAASITKLEIAIALEDLAYENLIDLDQVLDLTLYPNISNDLSQQQMSIKDLMNIMIIESKNQPIEVLNTYLINNFQYFRLYPLKYSIHPINQDTIKIENNSSTAYILDLLLHLKKHQDHYPNLIADLQESIDYFEIKNNSNDLQKAGWLDDQIANIALISELNNHDFYLVIYSQASLKSSDLQLIKNFIQNYILNKKVG